MKLSSRVRILEQKVNWIGSEVQLIRQMLEFMTKVIPTTSQFSVGAKSNDGLKYIMKNNGSKSSDSSDSQDTTYKSYKCPRRASSSNANQKFLSVQQDINSETFVVNAAAQEELMSQKKEKSPTQDQECSKDASDRIPVIKHDVLVNNSKTLGPCAPPKQPTRHCTKAVDLNSILPKNVSAIDIIHLWEFGTTDILPIKLWSKEQMAAGGERLSVWQQIILLFKEECGGNLRTFVCKYSASNGDIMSVPEIIARSQLGSKSSSNSVSADYQRAKEMTSASSVNEKRQNDKSAFNSVKSEKSFDEFQSYILPRKINGLKVSAKDVLQIWENGYGRIPPVKLWTPNQKLRQQSKISRWKKIVDIFKTECGGDLNTFEQRYSNESGVLMPIATIIGKYEQSHTSDATELKPTMSSLNQGWLSDQQSGSLPKTEKSRRGSWKIPEVEGQQRDFPAEVIMGSSSGGSYVNNQQKMFSTGYMWREMINSYSKEEFCREYINSHINEAVDGEQTPKDESPKETNEFEIEEESRSYTDKPQPDNSELQAEEKDSSSGVQIVVPDGHASTPPVLERCSSAQLCEVQSTSVITLPSSAVSPFTAIKSVLEGSLNRPLTSANSSESAENEAVPGQFLVKKSTEDIAVAVEKFVELKGGRHPVFPDVTDVSEIIELWENGNKITPPIRLLSSDVIEAHPKLSMWRKFMDIFYYTCNSDKNTLLRNFSTGDGKLPPVFKIVENYFRNVERTIPHIQAGSNINSFHDSTYMPMEKKEFKTVNHPLYILPRKINGRKVSAKDVINIWNHGFREIPPIGSWLPQHKIRQQSKISRWKKIVEIFEIDCKGSMEVFERKYSSKTNELFPIAAIISKYELEKDAENGCVAETSANSGFLGSF